MQSITVFRFSVLTATAAVSIGLFAGNASAQDYNGAASAGGANLNTDHVIVGLGAGYAPVYAGADKYHLVPVPSIDIKWKRFFASLHNGTGINIVATDHVTLGTSLTFLPGYSSSDVPRGIGSLSTGVGARVFGSLKARGLTFTLGGTKDIVSGTQGTLADARLSYRSFLTPRLMLIPTIGVTWADGRYNNRYYGVSAEQSLASGLPMYAPGSGVKDISTLAVLSYGLSEHLMLAAAAGATTLMGNDKNSPIVFHRNAQPSGFVSLSYRF